MSIAGDTQPRVPGFFSQPESVISPRKSGIAAQSAQLPGTLLQPTASGSGAIAVGQSSIASAANTVAMGNAVRASGSESVAYGYNIASSGATSNVVVGTNINEQAGGSGNLYIGSAHNTNPTSGATNMIVIGNQTYHAITANTLNTIAIGTLAYALGNNGIAIGNNARAGQNASSFLNNIAIGTSVSCSATSSPGASGCIGIGNTISNNSTNGIAIGQSITFSNATNPIAIGSSAGATSHGVGIGSSASATVNGVAIGALANNDFQGQINLCNAQFAAANDIATSFVSMYVQTTTAAATELRTGAGTASTAPTGNIACTNFSTYIFDVDIVARSVGSASVAAYNLKFAFNRNANAASSTISSLSKTILFTIGTVTGWDVTATADTTNGRPNISVTGAASTTIRWVGNVRMTKVATAS